MTSTDYKEANFTMRSGGNPNTVGLRVAIANHDQIPGYIFYVSKFEMEDWEKERFKEKLISILKNVDMMEEKDLIDMITNAIPPTYLSCMNSQVPVLLLQTNPFEEGFMKQRNDLADNLNSQIRPEEN